VFAQAHVDEPGFSASAFGASLGNSASDWPADGAANSCNALPLRHCPVALVTKCRGFTLNVVGGDTRCHPNQTSAREAKVTRRSPARDAKVDTCDRWG
jgi:hypothetical protein